MISGERQEDIEWHRVDFYNRLAVIGSEQLKNDPAGNADVRLKRASTPTCSAWKGTLP